MDEQPAPPTISLDGVCSECFFWRPVEMSGPVTLGQPKRGMCYGVPATPVPQYDARGNLLGQKDMRSCPVGSTPMCALFLPLPPGALPQKAPVMDLERARGKKG